MATKEELQGAFGSFLDTVQSRLDPFLPQDIVSRWTGIIASAGEIASAPGWTTLPEEDPAYGPVIDKMNSAAAVLASADSSDSGSVHAALSKVEDALQALSNVVGS